MAYIKLKDNDNKEYEFQVRNENEDVAISVGFGKFITLGEHYDEIQEQIEKKEEAFNENRLQDDEEIISQYMDHQNLIDIYDEYYTINAFMKLANKVIKELKKDNNFKLLQVLRTELQVGE